MANQSKNIIEEYIPTIVSIGAAAIGLYALYYVKISVPAEMVASTRKGIEEVALTTWNKTKDITYTATHTYPGLIITSQIIGLISLTYAVIHQGNNKWSLITGTVSYIITNMATLLGIMNWAVTGKVWSDFTKENPWSNTSRDDNSANLYEMLKASRSFEEFVIFLFIYSSKSLTLAVGNNDTLYAYDTNNSETSLRLVKYNNIVDISMYDPRIKDYITIFETSSLGIDNFHKQSIELTAIINGNMLPDGNLSNNHANNLTERTKNNIPSEIIGDIRKVIRY